MPIPDSTHFEGGLFPLGEFELTVERFEAGKDVRTDVCFKARYDRHSTLYLEVSPALQPWSFLREASVDPVISGMSLPSDVKLLTVSTDAHRSVFVPQQAPILFQPGGDAAVITAVVINGPSIGSAGGEMKFQEGDLSITLREFDSVEKYRKAGRLYQYDSIATGTLTLTADTGRLLGPEEALRKIGRVARFFTFLRGGDCAIGHILGSAADGGFSYCLLGFSKADPFKVDAGWCDDIVIRLAPQIYDIYSKAVSDPDQCHVILRAIEYYRASNVAKNSSGAVALVASYAALETLVPYVLTAKAGWTAQQVEDLKPFAARLAAALKHTGLTADLLQHSPAIANRIANEPGMDACAMLAKFRNRMTHYRKGFTYSVDELFEMWMISQWLCEILLFYLIGYRDVMIDRRRYNGWVEAPRKAPLP